jgi:uncharacterized membrane protein
MNSTDFSETRGIPSLDAHDPVYQAYEALRWGFTIAPILAGLDKFTHFLADWDQYLAPTIAKMLPLPGHSFMMIAGLVEIVAGVGVFLKPRVFGYVVAVWLVGIIINLAISGAYLDVALRDLGLALGAFALAKLSERFESITRA